MEEEQFEAIIVNPEICEEYVTKINGPEVGVMELGKRLLLAAKEGNTETVRNLMKGGAPFATDWLGTTSLHAAAAGGHLETCELLLRSGILKDARTKVDKTPLHMACQEGHSDVALLLLANGADVNACDMLQMTPLHWAVEKEKLETIKVLLQNGADPTMVNKFDKTCFDIANDSERHDIIDLLQIEPRRGEYTVVDTNKSEFRFSQPSRKISPTNTKPSIEIGNKSLDRPKTAIVLPTYQNKKGSTSKKEVKSTSDEERQNRMAALQLLEEHGIEMLDGEDINLVASAVESGQTVVLTEAGKQALSLTEEKGSRGKGLKRHVIDCSTGTKVIRLDSGITLSESVPGKSKLQNQNKVLRINKAKAIQLNPSIEDINKKFEEAKREAEQYKELYTKKQREAEEYRSKLETITLSACKAQEHIKIEEEEFDEEDFEEDCVSDETS
ncbi:UNVERIFIED_CONTAM: hypothetical protein PYX00_008374 [Menopon gallinae]|uniref:GA-binding protein subunit beta-1 n=1 Tax=Menopon gallinae TaxID=328185 RepID=A0AAW2HN81_9NEOP